MKKNFSKISVIIPVKPSGEIKETLEAISQVDYPQNLIEILVSYGFSPSKQRNEAAKKSQGEILYFLDNDSKIDKNALKRIAEVFSGIFKPVDLPYRRGFSFLPPFISDFIIKQFFSGKIYQGEIAAVGGPNLWLNRESFWQSISGIVLESFFSHGQMAARYRPIGQVHRATEKELILCNLAVKRKIFEKIGGFNEYLYPNEENELLHRIEKAGYQSIYHPGMIVYRPHREDIFSLLSSFFNYGRGRMEQIKIEGILINFLFLIPLFLLFYLIVIFLILFFAPRKPLIIFFPLFFYFFLGFCSALGFSLRKKKPHLSFFLPPLFLLVHLSYAFGMIYGFFSNLKKKKINLQKIKVVKIKSFNDKWQKST